MKKITLVLIIIGLSFIGCSDDFYQSNTTLTIKNDSDFNFINVTFQYDKYEYNDKNFEFGTINSKKSSTREIHYTTTSSEYLGEITFNLIKSDGNVVSCKTGKDIRIKKNKKISTFTFTNDTIVSYSENKSNTIKNIGWVP